ncbi:uncharacterized protein N7503_006078 [Penicillium pulvis]|uniref:uncharacterized protein n=1 Tax=Penicillium pulvis TaxID=1562058 RepID=UPI002546EC51|nr:uncharacterized protein N7503_006078 [Penicillium pulvis]KAJ5803628.1 hypothetical protein N7503_006078 [Penicillium pulvis]
MTALFSETLPDHENKSAGIAEIESLQSVHKEIAKRLDYYEAVAKKAREAEHLSNVKLRRQGELLQDALKSADAALTQNTDLRLRLDSLEIMLKDLSDEEVNKTTNRLYDDLEDWIKRHYGALQPVYPEVEPDADLDQPQEFWFSIYGFLSQQIFHIILSRFMVGTGSPGMNHALRMLDEKVQKIYPRNIGQYWRAGTSSAALMLARPELEATIGQIVESTEARYLHRAMPGTLSTRSGELKDLLWKFVNWKGRLERQSVQFYFWWVMPRLPLRTEYMFNLTGDDFPNATVNRSLSPALYRLTPGDSEPTLVRRAVVQVTDGSSITSNMV